MTESRLGNCQIADCGMVGFRIADCGLRNARTPQMKTSQQGGTSSNPTRECGGHAHHAPSLPSPQGDTSPDLATQFQTKSPQDALQRVKRRFRQAPDDTASIRNPKSEIRNSQLPARNLYRCTLNSFITRSRSGRKDSNSSSGALNENK